MKIRVVLITENDKPIPDGYSKEDMELATKYVWDYVIQQMANSVGDKAYVESVELVEE